MHGSSSIPCIHVVSIRNIHATGGLRPYSAKHSQRSMAEVMLNARTDATASQRPRDARPLTLLLVCGGLLIAVAGAAQLLSAEPHSNAIAPFVALPSALLASVEMAAGLFMALGSRRWPRAAWLVAVLAYLLLTETSILHWAAGASSCGCFGAVRINPRITTLVDLTIVLALASVWPMAWRRLDIVAVQPTWLSASIAAAVVVLPTCFAVLAHRTHMQHRQASGAIDVRQWIGVACPLLDRIDCGAELAKGDWTVILYRPGCQECQRVINSQISSITDAGDTTAGQLALVALPPFDTSSADHCPGAALCGRWLGSPDIAVSAPLHFALHDGIVGESQETGTPFPNYQRHRQRQFEEAITCGPLSLIAVARHLSVPLDEPQRSELIAAAGDRGTNLHQLATLANSIGLHSVAAAVSVDELRMLNHPAIVHFDGSSFAAAVQYTAGGIDTIYPSGQRLTMPDAQFALHFGERGRALLLSRDAFPARTVGTVPHTSSTYDGPHVHLTSTSVALGRMHRLDWSTSIVLANDGNAPLLLGAVTPSCACITTSLSSSTIQPGHSTVLTLEGQQSGPGVITHHVDIPTNASETPRLAIPIRGYVERPAVPSAPGIIIHATAGHAAVSDTDLILAQPYTANDVRIDIPDKTALSVHVEPAPRPHLAIDWQDTTRPGWYRQRLKLGVVDSPPELLSPFDVVIHVVPVIEALPASVTLMPDRDARGDWRRTVTLRLHQPVFEPVELAWDDATSPISAALSFNAFEDVPPTTAAITLSLAGRRPPVGVHVLRLLNQGVELGSLRVVCGSPRRMPGQ